MGRLKVCPTPTKISFTNNVEAMIKAKRAGDWNGQEQETYRCRCGKFHITTKRERTKE